MSVYVRVLAMTISPIKVRRKPLQSRSRMTQDALIESFVQLLQEKSAAAMTIREITEIAGVGLGTFYEYFSQKEDLIALTIHQFIKHNARCLQQQAPLLINHGHLPLKSYIQQLLQSQLEQIQRQQLIWAKLFLLERQVSSPEAYQKHYALMIDAWHTTLSLYANANHVTPHFDFAALALNIHRISYSFISQSLLCEAQFSQWSQLQADLFIAIDGFVPPSICILPQQYRNSLNTIGKND